jgi:hypothetical protein
VNVNPAQRVVSVQKGETGKRSVYPPEICTNQLEGLESQEASMNEQSRAQLLKPNLP